MTTFLERADQWPQHHDRKGMVLRIGMLGPQDRNRGDRGNKLVDPWKVRMGC